MNEALNFTNFVIDQPIDTNDWISSLKNHATKIIEFSSPLEVYVPGESGETEIELPSGIQTTVKNDFSLYQFKDLSTVLVMYTEQGNYLIQIGIVNGRTMPIKYIQPSKA